MKKTFLLLAGFCLLTMVACNNAASIEQAAKQLEEIESIVDQNAAEYQAKKDAECRDMAMASAAPIADSILLASKNKPLAREKKPKRPKRPTPKPTPTPTPAPAPAPTTTTAPPPPPPPPPPKPDSKTKWDKVKGETTGGTSGTSKSKWDKVKGETSGSTTTGTSGTGKTSTGKSKSKWDKLKKKKDN